MFSHKCTYRSSVKIGFLSIEHKIHKMLSSVFVYFSLTHVLVMSAQSHPENLTNVTWAHAVNNKSLLKQTLNSPVMMIEADIVYGKLNGQGDDIPIMGHPPANQSDLSLESFLLTVDNYNTKATIPKGVKLDFKSTQVFLKSLAIIKQIQTNYPVWLNADILPGPFNPQTIPVNAKIFLENTKFFTKSILSLGWTTNYTTPNISYTTQQISDMLDVIKEVKQEITFPVRAGIAAESIEQMMELMKRPNTTLTIWSSPGDPVNVANLRRLIIGVGCSRTFVDVPQDLRQDLNLNCSASTLSNVMFLGLIMLFVLIL